MCREWGGGKGQIENVDMVVMSNEELVLGGGSSPSPWSFHLSLNENILFDFQARVVMREVYVNFIFSLNFLLGISILVFGCLLFQRHLYANMFMLIIFMFPLRLCFISPTREDHLS